MSLWNCSEHGLQGPSKWNMCPTCGRGMSRAEIHPSARSTGSPASVAAVDPHAGSTGTTSTRETTSSPSDFSASARTVTRYRIFDQCRVLLGEAPRQAMQVFEPDTEICLYSEVAPLLTELAQQDEAIARLKDQLDGYQNREAACCPEGVGFEELIPRLKISIATWRSWAQLVYLGSGAVAPETTDIYLRAKVCETHDAEISALTARAEAAEAEAKSLQDHVDLHIERATARADALRAQLEAAESENVRLRAELDSK